MDDMTRAVGASATIPADARETVEAITPVIRPGQRDLTQGPIAKTLLLFAVPTLGASVLQSLSGSVNAIWVGRFLGEAALTATANANIVLFLLIAAVFGFAMATSILVGQAIGRGDLDGARRAVGAGAFLFVGIAIVVAALGWLSTPSLLRLMDTPPAAQQLATAYLRIIFLGTPANFLLSFLMGTQRGAGDARTPLYFMALLVVLDIVLNPILILGLGPLPPMGIAGSALAAVVASLVAAVGMVAYIYANDLPLRLRGAELGYLRPSRTLTRAILGKGLPMGLQLIVVSLSAIVMIGFVNSYGVATAAAYGVTVQLWSYIQMPSLALGAATTAMAAQNIGAGKWDRVGRIAGAGVIMSVVMTGVLVALVTIVDRPALGLFLQAGSPSVDIAAHIHLIVSPSFMLLGVTFVLFGIIRAAGSVLPPVIILLVSLFVVRIGVAALLEPEYGVEAIWWSYPASSAVSMILAFFYYRAGGWRTARMI